MQPQDDLEVKQFSQREKAAAGVATGAAVVAGTVAIAEVPAQAAGAIDDVTAMVTSLGAIATAATVVILAAMGVRLAVKFVNRLTVKG